MSYCNLLKEVTEFTEKYGIPEHVKIYGKGITWERFTELARGTDYDDGFGGPEIEGSLMLMWKDKVAVRATYDGAEWFEIIDISVPTEDISDKVTGLTVSAQYGTDFEGSAPVGGY